MAAEQLPLQTLLSTWLLAFEDRPHVATSAAVQATWIKYHMITDDQFDSLNETSFPQQAGPLIVSSDSTGSPHWQLQMLNFQINVYT